MKFVTTAAPGILHLFSVRACAGWEVTSHTHDESGVTRRIECIEEMLRHPALIWQRPSENEGAAKAWTTDAEGNKKPCDPECVFKYVRRGDFYDVDLAGYTRFPRVGFAWEDQDGNETLLALPFHDSNHQHLYRLTCIVKELPSAYMDVLASLGDDRVQWQQVPD